MSIASHISQQLLISEFLLLNSHHIPIPLTVSPEKRKKRVVGYEQSWSFKSFSDSNDNKERFSCYIIFNQ